MRCRGTSKDTPSQCSCHIILFAIVDKSASTCVPTIAPNPAFYLNGTFYRRETEVESPFALRIKPVFFFWYKTTMFKCYFGVLVDGHSFVSQSLARISRINESIPFSETSITLLPTHHRCFFIFTSLLCFTYHSFGYFLPHVFRLNGLPLFNACWIVINQTSQAIISLFVSSPCQNLPVLVHGGHTKHDNDSIDMIHSNHLILCQYPCRHALD
jgi:hypothetical protein